MKKISKREASRYVALTILLLTVALGGCGKQEGTQGENKLTITPSIAPTQAVLPTEALTPTEQVTVTPNLPAATNTPTPASESDQVTQVPQATPTQQATPTSQAIPETHPEIKTAFEIVTPIPKQMVKDVKGQIAKDAFPKVDGSTATIPLSEALYQYATGATAEEASRAIVHTKTTNSYRRLYNGEVDLLIVYEPAEEIVKRMENEKLLIKPIGLDALVFMANTANPVNSLTMEQLIDIYSGKLDNWASVGGEDKKLYAFQRPIGSGSQTLMQKLVMGTVPMAEGDNVFRYSTMADILQGMLSYHGEDNTLGYSVFYYANNMYHLPDLKFMGVDGVLPSTQTIYDGSYPLVNAFYAVIRPEEAKNSNARLLFDFLTGEEGQEMILSLGYVPVDMPDGAKLVEMVPEDTSIELTKHAPIPEGEYYVLTIPQVYDTEEIYGDMIVYKDNWEVCAKFYNVLFKYEVKGSYSYRYLPVGQIRMNGKGEQSVHYGIYDLEAGEYTVTPSFEDLYILDLDKGYFVVPPQNRKEYEHWWMHYRVIDAQGNAKINDVYRDDWIMISKEGNCYVSVKYGYEDSYSNYPDYYIYDSELQLKSVFYHNKWLEHPENREDGVAYYEDGEGYVLDQNGDIIFSKEIFLERYGNGADETVKWGDYFYGSVSYTGEDQRYVPIYQVIYAGERYLLALQSDEMQLIRKIKEENVGPGQYVSYYTGYYIMGGCYYAYDHTPLKLMDGKRAQRVERDYASGSYALIYWDSESSTLHAEEHNDFTKRIALYEMKCVDPAALSYDFYFSGDGYYYISVDNGQTIKNPNKYGEDMVTLRSFYLYYHGQLMGVYQGTSAWMNQMADGTYRFEIWTGKVQQLESQSLFIGDGDGYMDRVYLKEVVLKDGVVLYDVPETTLRCQDMKGYLQLEDEKYIYITDYSGNLYVKALHRALGND